MVVITLRNLFGLHHYVVCTWYLNQHTGGSPWMKKWPQKCQFQFIKIKRPFVLNPLAMKLVYANNLCQNQVHNQY